MICRRCWLFVDVNQCCQSSAANPNWPPPEVGSRLPGTSGWKRTLRPRSVTDGMSGFSGDVMTPPLTPQLV